MLALFVFILITLLTDFLCYNYLKKRDVTNRSIRSIFDELIAVVFVVSRGLNAINLTILLAYVIKPYL